MNANNLVCFQQYERFDDVRASFRGGNKGFWYHLGCSGRNADIFSHQGVVKGCTRKIKKRKHCRSVLVAVLITRDQLEPSNCLQRAICVHFRVSPPEFDYRFVVTKPYLDLAKTNSCLSVLFRMIPFRGEIRHEPRPDWSSLVV